MVEEIELYKIGDFPNHPFRVRYDEEMSKLTKSQVKKHLHIK